MNDSQAAPQEQAVRECLVCHRKIEGRDLERAEKLRYFEDLCVCLACLEAERGGTHATR